MQATVKTQESSSVSCLPETPHCGHPYTRFVGSLLGRIALRFRWYCLVGTWHIWRAAARSCCGHIRLQSPTDMLGAAVGPALEQDRAGCYQRNTRTIARAFYTEMLVATYNWVDIVDLRIFLMGFDAGEQWTLHTMGNETQTSTLKSSWLNLAEQKCGTVSDKIHNNTSLFC